MDTALIALWASNALTAVGVVYAISHDGRSRRAQDEKLKIELKKDIETINEKLDDENDGLGAIRREVSKQKEHCASITAEYKQRLKSLEDKKNAVSS
jgi:septal ring factor EnvC (AmiA/AmiB activator)